MLCRKTPFLSHIHTVFAFHIKLIFVFIKSIQVLFKLKTKTMKRTKILYWVFTGLFGAFMLFSAIPDLLTVPDAVKMVHDDLGYPVYIIPFLGLAKILGVIAIIIPGFPRIKEWAYAGLAYDLIGATYSLYCIDPSPKGWMGMLGPILIGALSYYFYHKKLKSFTASQTTI